MFPFYLIFSRKHRGFGKEILTAVSERLSLLINKGKVGGGGGGKQTGNRRREQREQPAWCGSHTVPPSRVSRNSPTSLQKQSRLEQMALAALLGIT